MSDLVTKADLEAALDATKAVLRSDLRVALDATKEELRSDLHVALDATKEELRSDLHVALDATKEELRSDIRAGLEATKDDFRRALDGAVHSIITEMGIRFAEIGQRMDRMEARLDNQGRQLAAGTRVLAGITEWSFKADADYGRVLAELADLKIRVFKLEAR